MPDLCIVFGCCNKSDSENGTALHTIPFFNDHHPEWVRSRKKNRLTLQSFTVYACFVGKWNPEMASQRKLDPFSCIVTHGPKLERRPTFLLWKGTTPEGKIQGQKLFRQSKQGSSESLFMRKKIFGASGSLRLTQITILLTIQHL